MTTITGRDTGDECECLNCQGVEIWMLHGVFDFLPRRDCTVISQDAITPPPEKIKVRWPEGWTDRDLKGAMQFPQWSIGYRVVDA